jgi:hypothetical protein
MKRALAAGPALALLAARAGAAAKPTTTDRANAAREYRAERGSTDATREAFRAKYGTNKRGRNAFGKCASARGKAKEEQADQQDAEKTRERKGAAKECAAARSESGREPFSAKYGTNRNKRNSFGKCVSQNASS